MGITAKNVAGVALGTGLAIKGAQARKKWKKRRRHVKKNPSKVWWLAAGMFAWGLLKGRFLSLHLHPHPDCAYCVNKSLQGTAHPRHLLRSVVFGPWSEEVMFRHNLQPILGQGASSALFGAVHAIPRLGSRGNLLRVLEAGLAGAFAYGEAYNHGGLLGSTFVHAAHNAGADLGGHQAFKSQLDRIRQQGSRGARWKAPGTRPLSDPVSTNPAWDAPATGKATPQTWPGGPGPSPVLMPPLKRSRSWRPRSATSAPVGLPGARGNGMF